MNLAIFDVCGTLYDENTTYGFLSFFHQRIGSDAFQRLNARWMGRTSPFFYLGALSYRLRGLDIARSHLVASLRGVPEADLVAASEAYAETVLPRRKNQPLIERLERHRAAGDRIVLISNSLDFVIAGIAKTLQVEFRASKLGFAEGLCTGRIEVDLTGRKASLLPSLTAGLGPGKHVYVYTDNLSDRDLIERADQAAIVIR
jgi:HAD superfamily phosphoserine phosphatase-like hydrolase